MLLSGENAPLFDGTDVSGGSEPIINRVNCQKTPFFLGVPWYLRTPCCL